MIVDLDTLKTFMGIPETDDSENELLNIYLQGVDSLFNDLCDYEFDSTTYTHELHNGGGQRLWLKHIPVTAITQLSTERIPAIKIKNTSSDAARCTIDVDVSASYLYYAIVGGTNATARTGIDLAAAATDTLAELVTAIDALGKGWDAEIYDTDLNSIPSSELLEVMGLNCGVPRGGGAATWKYLDIPGTPLGGEFRLESEEEGMIYCPSGFPSGINNVIVTYTAGYSSTTMPRSLKLAVCAGAQALYNKGEEDGFGVQGFTIGALRLSYADWLPDITLQAMSRYKRKSI